MYSHLRTHQKEFEEKRKAEIAESSQSRKRPLNINLPADPELEPPVAKQPKLTDFVEKMSKYKVTGAIQKKFMIKEKEFHEEENNEVVEHEEEDLEDANAGLFPLLSYLAGFVLWVPAASSKSERVFSVAGQVVTGKRASLGSKKVEDLVIMACNSRLINKFEV